MKHRLSGLRGYPYIEKLRSIARSEGLNIQVSFDKIIKEKDKFNLKDLSVLAIEYRLPVTAMSEILEELRLLPTGTWERAKARGCTAKSIGVEWNGRENW
jgi:hypothetical protein